MECSIGLLSWAVFFCVCRGYCTISQLCIIAMRNDISWLLNIYSIEKMWCLFKCLQSAQMPVSGTAFNVCNKRYFSFVPIMKQTFIEYGRELYIGNIRNKGRFCAWGGLSAKETQDFNQKDESKWEFLIDFSFVKKKTYFAIIISTTRYVYMGSANFPLCCFLL